jgi:hypothetical protein
MIFGDAKVTSFQLKSKTNVGVLPGHIDSAFFPDDGHFDLAWVCHLSLYFLGYLKA